MSMEEENIVDVFDVWFKHYTEASSQLADKEENLKKSAVLIETLTKANSRLQTDEVRYLKQEVADKDQTLQVESIQNKAVIEKIKKDNEIEKESVLTNLEAEYDKKLADIDCQLKAEIEAKLSLQSHLEDVQKDKDKTLSKITMEYESKLAKAHRQKAQYLQHHQQVLNQDILRKKMQHMKENYEQEIATLKSQIQDLKHMLESMHHGKQVKENHMQFSEQQQPQKLYQQEQQQQKPHLQEQQRQRRLISQQDHKNISKYRSTSGSKLKL